MGVSVTAFCLLKPSYTMTRSPMLTVAAVASAVGVDAGPSPASAADEEVGSRRRREPMRDAMVRVRRDRRALGMRVVVWRRRGRARELPKAPARGCPRGG